MVYMSDNKLKPSSFVEYIITKGYQLPFVRLPDPVWDGPSTTEHLEDRWPWPSHYTGPRSMGRFIACASRERVAGALYAFIAWATTTSPNAVRTPPQQPANSAEDRRVWIMSCVGSSMPLVDLAVGTRRASMLTGALLAGRTTLVQRARRLSRGNRGGTKRVHPAQWRI